MQEFLAVAIDVLDPHGGDHLAELAEDDVAGLLLDFLDAKPQKPDRRVLHGFLIGADGHGEHAGHVDADVLHGQGALEGDFDLDRLQAQKGVILNERQDQARPAVQAARARWAAGHLAEYDQNTIAGAALVARHQGHGEGKEHQGSQADGGQNLPGNLGGEQGIRHDSSFRFRKTGRPPRCRR